MVRQRQRQRGQNQILERSRSQDWDMNAIGQKIGIEYNDWWQSLEARKKESARNFDRQLHDLRSSWPRLDSQNELIRTGYIPFSDKIKESVLLRDMYTCRICCWRQSYC